MFVRGKTIEFHFAAKCFAYCMCDVLYRTLLQVARPLDLSKIFCDPLLRFLSSASFEIFLLRLILIEINLALQWI